MECQECQENLSSLIDGELGKKEYQTILAHIMKCKSCFGELCSFLAIQTTVKEHAPVIMPGDALWEKIETKLKPRKKLAFSLKRFFRPFSMQPVFLKRIEVALLAVFSLFAFLYFTNSQITINRQEISLRFKQSSPGFMNIREESQENLSRKDLLLLIDELRRRQNLQEEEFYNLSEENGDMNDYPLENKAKEERKDYS